MYNIVFPKTFQYSEVFQSNPIRWTILYKQDDGNFEACSSPLKCRDFFNDVVAKFNNILFDIYGFSSRLVKKNEEGIYMELSGIYNTEVFKKSIEDAINPKIAEQFGEENVLTFTIKDANTGLLLIPSIFFEKTYYISAVTMLIRSCNRPTEVTSWDHLWDTFKEEWDEKVCKYVRKNGFLTPKQTNKFWYFFSEKANSDTDGYSQYNIHNCGVKSWLYAANFGEA